MRAQPGLGPIHVGQQVAGLHRCDDAEVFEAGNVGCIDHLGVLDAIARRQPGQVRIARRPVLELADCARRLCRSAAVWTGRFLIPDCVGLSGGAARTELRDQQVLALLGQCEGVQSHGSGLVADGVKSELESEPGALIGHLVQLLRRVLGKASVAWIVRIGRFHRGSSRAQRTIHEPLQHPRMQHRIVGIVVIAHPDEIRQWSLEG